MSKNKAWYNKNTGSSAENSANREAPNKHLKGSKKYKEWISKETKQIDKHSNLPFQFIKPPKRSQYRREIFAVCTSCSNVSLVNVHTAGVVCSTCSKYFSIGEGNRFSTEEDLEAFFLALKKKKPDDK